MKIEKLKIYGATLAMIAAMSMNPHNTMTVYAEDEVLFEDTKDDHVLEDIVDTNEQPGNDNNNNQDNNQNNNQDNNQNNNQDNTHDNDQNQEQENDQGNDLPSGNDSDKNTNDDLNNTEIDPEDQEYNTGREEIPDYVQTEAERKGLTNETPNDPPAPPAEDKPSTPPAEETPVPPAAPPAESQPIPKTGMEIKHLIGIGGALGLIAGSLIQMQYLSRINKVVGSKKKFRKRSKKKTK